MKFKIGDKVKNKMTEQKGVITYVDWIADTAKVDVEGWSNLTMLLSNLELIDKPNEPTKSLSSFRKDSWIFISMKGKK